ncbi:MAG: chorismate mutase [Treponema sp.]
MKRLFALRGAACAKNTAASITESVVALCSAIFERNNLAADDIVSLQFSLTSDLDEINPCAALRKNYSGGVDVSRVPLFCTQEASVKNALPRVIRLIAHVYMEENAKPVHVYTRGAEVLRPDFTTETKKISDLQSNIDGQNEN